MAVKKPSTKGLGIYLALLLAFLLMATTLFSQSSNQQLIKYSTVLGYFENGQVSEFNLNLGSGNMTMLVEQNGKKAEVNYRVPNVTQFMYDIEDDIDSYNEEHPDNKMVYDLERAAEIPWFVSMLPTLILVGSMGIFLFMMMRQTRGNGGMSGFSKAKPRTPQDGRVVTFADVAGADEEKEELVEIVEFLKNPAKYNALGARIPKGVLLMGPPGTGKTLLARAVAGEAGVPFYSISGSDFVEMFVGVGASRVRDLFAEAKKTAPSIIFIDEIDAVGRHRGAGLGGGHDEREQTLNQLLVEMDGFGANSGVIIIAATNRKDILDPALLRPGRFDRQILVSYPDVKGREEILKVHVRNKPMGPDVELKTVAKATVGFTGADLENVVNEAALLAARANKHAITMKEIEDATIKVIAGPEKRSKVVNDKEKRLTAYHEAGHAVCTYYCPTQDPVHEISIIPRGMAGGYTMSLPEDDRGYMSKTAMQENIVTLLGGRMAELIVLDDISTGASNDLERATQIARSMVTRYGFSDKLGPVVYGQDQGEVFLGMDINRSRNYSEEVAAEIDEEIRRIIEEAYARAREILEAHRDQLEVVAQYLMEHEKVGEFGFKALMEGREVNPDEDQHGGGTPRPAGSGGPVSDGAREGGRIWLQGPDGGPGGKPRRGPARHLLQGVFRGTEGSR